jgi:hypothetical protein
MPKDYEEEAAYVNPRPYGAGADREGSGIKQRDIREIALWRSDREMVPQLCQPLGLCVAVQTKMPTGQLADILGTGQVVINILVLCPFAEFKFKRPTTCANSPWLSADNWPKHRQQDIGVW